MIFLDYSITFWCKVFIFIYALIYITSVAFTARSSVQQPRSYRQVAEMLDVHLTTIYRALRRFQETGSFERGPGQGQPSDKPAGL